MSGLGLGAGTPDLIRNSGTQRCWRGKHSLPEIGVSPWEHESCLTETTREGFFYPFTRLCRAIRPLEWGSWCAVLQAELPAASQKFCGGVLKERQNKAKLHFKLLAAVYFIYLIFIFPTTFSNVERCGFLVWLVVLLFIRTTRALALWSTPSPGFRRCASTVKAVPTLKSSCYKTWGNG